MLNFDAFDESTKNFISVVILFSKKDTHMQITQLLVKREIIK